MRNRAKCKLCKSVIESFLVNDFVSCQCGEISISGGNSDNFLCEAKDWSNFLRIDDEGNEVIVKVVEKNEKKESPVTLDDLFHELDLMIEYQDRMPKEVLSSYVNYYDFYSALFVIKNILNKMKRPPQL
jgi:hypothetical protein